VLGKRSAKLTKLLGLLHPKRTGGPEKKNSCGAFEEAKLRFAWCLGRKISEGSNSGLAEEKKLLKIKEDSHAANGKKKIRVKGNVQSKE